MRIRPSLRIFRSAGKGLLIGVLVVFGALWAYFSVVPPFPWVSAAPALYGAMTVQGLLTLLFLVRGDWGAAAGLWLTWPFLVALRLWIIPAYDEARNFIVHYDRFYTREVAAPSQPITTLTLLLGRIECETECATNLRDDLGLDYLGIVNVRLGAPNSEIEVTRDGSRRCEEPARPFEVVRRRPLEFRRTPTDCTFREEWSRITPRIDVYYYAPLENAELGAPGKQYLLVTEVTEAGSFGERLAVWEVGSYPDDWSSRRLQGRPFTLDDALSEIFGRQVTLELWAAR